MSYSIKCHWWLLVMGARSIRRKFFVGTAQAGVAYGIEHVSPQPADDSLIQTDLREDMGRGNSMAKRPNLSYGRITLDQTLPITTSDVCLSSPGLPRPAGSKIVEGDVLKIEGE